MEAQEQILQKITTIAERWVMGRENDDEAMRKILKILRDNHRLKYNYLDIINTTTKTR
jgi:hypothetical protein